MASRSRQFSARFSTDLVEGLDRQAQRTGESRSRLAQRYLEEGLRMDRHPGIVFRDGPAGRRPGLVGGPDVWEVVAHIRQRQERGEAALTATAAALDLQPSQVQAVVAYYADHLEEVDAWIARNEAEAEAAEAAWRRAQAALA
jgi:hypothetical protein